MIRVGQGWRLVKEKELEALMTSVYIHTSDLALPHGRVWDYGNLPFSMGGFMERCEICEPTSPWTSAKRPAEAGH